MRDNNYFADGDDDDDTITDALPHIHRHPSLPPPIDSARNPTEIRHIASPPPTVVPLPHLLGAAASSAPSTSTPPPTTTYPSFAPASSVPPAGPAAPAVLDHGALLASLFARPEFAQALASLMATHSGASALAPPHMPSPSLASPPSPLHTPPPAHASTLPPPPPPPPSITAVLPPIPPVASPPNPWFTVGASGSILRSPASPAHSSIAPPSTSPGTQDDDEAELLLSQSDFTPPLLHSSPIPILASSDTTAAVSLQRHRQADSHTRQLRHDEGRVWRFDDIKRDHVIIKFGLNAAANFDQAPNDDSIEAVLDCILTSCSLPFPVDRVAIISFSTPMPTRGQGNVYFSYAFVSPRSTHPNQSPSPPRLTKRAQLEMLQSALHSRLDGPSFFKTIPHLPDDAKHFHVNMPFTNTMGETLCFILEGISVNLLLGDTDRENVLTLRHLGFLLFKQLKLLYPTVPPFLPFPRELARYVTRFDVGSILSVKKVKFSAVSSKSDKSDRPPPPLVRPLLGIVLTKISPIFDLLNDAFTHVCIKQSQSLPVCGCHSLLSVRLHTFTSHRDVNINTGRGIVRAHQPLHDDTLHLIKRDIRISMKVLQSPIYLIRAANAFGNCLGFLFDFSRGITDLRLTGIFRTHRDTSYLSSDQISSRIVEFNKSEINLTPSPFDASLAPPTSQRHPPSPTVPPRGRGRNSRHSPSPAHSSTRPPNDLSPSHFRARTTSALAITSLHAHKYHAVINGVGGIACANIYTGDFYASGISSLVTGIPYNRHFGFSTHPEAWSYFSTFFPHLTSPDDVKFMNQNCPKEASNLSNPSQHLRDLTNFCPRIDAGEFTYFDELSPPLQALRIAATARMHALGKTPSDGYTFFPNDYATHPIPAPNPPPHPRPFP